MQPFSYLRICSECEAIFLIWQCKTSNSWTVCNGTSFFRIIALTDLISGESIREPTLNITITYNKTFLFLIEYLEKRLSNHDRVRILERELCFIVHTISNKSKSTSANLP